VSDVDISLLNQVLPQLSVEFPEYAQDILALRAMADGVRDDPAEDNVLTEDEIRSSLDQIAAGTRSQISILTENRDVLVGNMQQAMGILARAGADEGLGQAMLQAAYRDGNPQELTDSEIQSLLRGLEEALQVNTPEHVQQGAEDLVRQLELLRRHRPELFYDERPEVQTLPIEVNFLRNLSHEQWNQLRLVHQGLSSGALSLENPQVEPQLLWAVMLAEGLVALGVDPENDRLPEGHLEITYPRFLQNRQRLSNLRPNGQPTPEQHFAEIRAGVYLAWQALINQSNLMAQEGVQVGPLANRAQDLPNREDVQVLMGTAGMDQILTHEEADLLTIRQQLLDGQERISPDAYLQRAQTLVQELGDFGFRLNAENAPTPEDARRDRINREIIRDLGYMNHGYTNYDEWLIENSFFSNLAHFATWVATNVFPPTAALFYGVRKACDMEPQSRESDILPVWNHTYLHYAREGVEAMADERHRAVQFLSRLMGYETSSALEGEHLETRRVPRVESRAIGPDQHFVEWLEARPEGQREVTVANALEYMAGYEGRYNQRVQTLMASGRFANDVEAKGYLFSRGWDAPGSIADYHRILTGPLFRAQRLSEIRQMEDRGEAEQAWFQLAQDIEETTWSFFGAHTWDGSGYWGEQEGAPQWWWTRNAYFSRTIYGALARQASDPELRLQARQARQDSMGMDIRDGEGNVLERGGGNFSILTPFIEPWNLFRNYSLENTDMGVENAVSLIPLFKLAKAGVTGMATLRSSLPAIRQGLMNLASVRGATAALVSGLGMAMGSWGRWFSTLGRGAAPVAAREATEAAPQLMTQAAAQGTTQAAAQGGVELASQAVRQPGFWTPFTEAWANVNSAGSFASYAFNSINYFFEGLKNLGRNGFTYLRNATVGSSPRLHAASQAMQLGARKVYLPQIWQGFRSTVNWRNFFSATPIEYYHRSRRASSLGFSAPDLEEAGIEIPEDSEAAHRSGMDAASPRLIEDRTYRLDLPREEALPPVDMIFTVPENGDGEPGGPPQLQNPGFDEDE
jgi:hypothetical protein